MQQATFWITERVGVTSLVPGSESYKEGGNWNM